MVIGQDGKFEAGGGFEIGVGLPSANSPRVGIFLLMREEFGVGAGWRCGGKIGPRPLTLCARIPWIQHAAGRLVFIRMGD